MELDLNSVLDICIDVALGAGEIMTSFHETAFQYETKTNAKDIVTEVDKKTEDYIKGRLEAIYSDHHFVGEESGGTGAPEDQAEYFWFIDPIDGTTNFASGIPYFCTSIAMTDSQINPLVGVVYNPISQELFAAVKGQGATRNNQPIQVTKTKQVVQSVVTTGFGYDVATNADNNLREWKSILTQTRGARVMGSSALDLCNVACGRFDAYWERNLNRWDVMAGLLIAEEAGGKVTDYQGNPYPQVQIRGKYLASNGYLHQEFINLLNSS